MNKKDYRINNRSNGIALLAMLRMPVNAIHAWVKSRAQSGLKKGVIL